MTWRAGPLLAIAVTGSGAAAHEVATPDDQTIVLLRHGEKPASGLGQLDCQGLNRALALPAVLAKLLGRPDAVFAPNPSIAKTDNGISYDYVRPLATIEPAAIRFGLPVNVTYGEADWQGLANRLSGTAYRPKAVVIAWEHATLVKLARALVTAQGGDAAQIPDWNREDFDSVYVLHIRFSAPEKGVVFDHVQEGLNNLPKSCPAGPSAAAP